MLEKAAASAGVQKFSKKSNSHLKKTRGHKGYMKQIQYQKPTNNKTLPYKI
jgi:hypothetical protein